ncbi:MAG: polyprenyl synthetase family protein [Elusimicrobiota bacterium]
MWALHAVDESLERVRAGLERRVASLGARVGDHLAEYVGRPGKMLRARYTLLLGAALGVKPGTAEKVARAIELVHNASLLHDDCIDEALMRRGVKTPNARFGDRTGILLGDLAFTEGMAEAVAVSPKAVAGLVESVGEMTVGEIQEEYLCGSLNVSVEGYYGVAVRKTAALFDWAGRTLSDQSPLEHAREIPPKLGRSAGLLLQIIDDIHDYTLDEETAGKDFGQDFANGRLTLPAILAMDDEKTRPEFLKTWRGRAKAPDAFAKALDILKKGGHLEAARKIAREIMEGMLPMAAALPEKAAAGELKRFMELLFCREF